MTDPDSIAADLAKLERMVDSLRDDLADANRRIDQTREALSDLANELDKAHGDGEPSDAAEMIRAALNIETERERRWKRGW
jgi:uncharacterized coiled-coil protein SlyX